MSDQPLSPTAPLIIQRGAEDYQITFEAMRSFTDTRDATTPDELWIVEHPPVFTLGLGADRSHVLAPHDIPLIQTDRGGEVTYHGPGQIVGYPIIDLRAWKRDVVAFVRGIEEVVIETLRHFGIEGRRDPGATGVWTPQGKVCAIGVHISRWVSTHGFALNWTTDLEYFRYIVPCGLARPVTSMERLGVRVGREQIHHVLVEEFARVFSYEMAPVSA